MTSPSTAAAGAIVHELRGQPLIQCRDGILLVRDFTLDAAPSGH